MSQPPRALPATLPWRHFLLALAVVTVWGTNFVVIKVALGHLPPFLFAALRFTPSARQRIAGAIIQRPEPGIAFLHPRRAVAGLGQLNGVEDALVVIIAVLPVSFVETGGNGGFAQRAGPDAGEVGGVGEQRCAGKSDSSDGLEHGYLTSGCLMGRSG